MMMEVPIRSKELPEIMKILVKFPTRGGKNKFFSEIRSTIFPIRIFSQMTL
jgi:hypothetical protein